MSKEPLPSRDTLFGTAWREHLDVKLRKLKVDVDALEPSAQRDLAHHFLHRAGDAVTQRDAWRAPVNAWTGVAVERAWVSTHAAQVALFRGCDNHQAAVLLPSIVAESAPALPSDDPRVTALREVAQDGKRLTASTHALAADVLESSYSASDADHVQVRSFRNILFAATFALTVLAVLIGVIASRYPDAFAVCDRVAGKVASNCPTGQRRPSGGDVFLVEILGLAGAAITAATAIRNLQGTSTPYAVPLASLLLKLPAGAITASLGLLLLRAGFAESVQLNTQAQVVAYAVLFGASQQLFLRLVDKQAQVVLASVGKKT